MASTGIGKTIFPLEVATKRHTATKCCHTKTKVKGLCETKLYVDERTCTFGGNQLVVEFVVKNYWQLKLNHKIYFRKLGCLRKYFNGEKFRFMVDHQFKSNQIFLQIFV